MGRLCLYGPRAARLHEELVPVTARWIEPSLRKQGLSPYGREAELKTLDLLETALLPTGAKGVDPVIQEKLRIAAAPISRSCCRTWSSEGGSSPKVRASPWPSERSRKPPP